MIHPSNKSEEMYIDIGVYGVPKAKNFVPKTSTRDIEKFVMDVKGYVFLRLLELFLNLTLNFSFKYTYN